MNKYQYRITLNNNQYPITDNYPGDQWSQIAEHQEERGYHAILEKRLITDESILPLLTNPTGYLKLKDNTVICPFETIAELY
jgi:hypothetical protein